MPYLFLKEDLEKLHAKREAIRGKYRGAGAEAGEACNQGAETFHDNAAYDIAMQEMHLQGTRLQDTDQVLRDVQVVEKPISRDIAAVGHSVSVVSADGQKTCYVLGSYIIIDDEQTPLQDGSAEHPYRISYGSPIGRAINNRSVGYRFKFPAGPRGRDQVIAEIR